MQTLAALQSAATGVRLAESGPVGPDSATLSKRTFLAVAALYLGHAAIFGGYIADDAGISLAYARNLAAGFGPVLYAGGEAVEGFSNPLWTALITAGAALGLDGADGIPLLKVLGLLFGAGTIGLTALVARQAYSRDDRPLRWLAAAILAVWTPFVFWSGAGLENPLYTFLIVLAVLLQLGEIDNQRARPWSALALTGVALTRPEGCAFFLGFLVHRIITVREGWRLLTWVGIFVAIYSAFLGARMLTFGDWLPNTYYAKIGDREVGELWNYISREDPGFSYLTQFAVANLVLLAVAAVGLADRRYWRANLLLVFVGGGTALYALYVGGDFWPAFRFLTPAFPILAIAAQHAVSMVPRRAVLLRPAIAAMLVGLVTYGSLRSSLELRAKDLDDTLISLQGRLDQGRRMRALATALGVTDPLYLDPDIGGPSVAGLRVLDLGGLTDIHIARFQWYPAFLREYIFKEQRPHIIRTHSTWTRTSRVTGFPEFQEQYVAVDEQRDSLGVHGEFIRRDLLTRGGMPDSGPARRRPSFGQAVEATRARRIREDARERDGWIAYYADRLLHERLLGTFRQRQAEGTLPTDPAQLADLYYGLLAAGDRAAADRVRYAAGLTGGQPIVLRDGSTPVLSLITHRVLQREMDWARLELFFDVLRAPGTDVIFTLQLSRQKADGVEPLVRDISRRRAAPSFITGTTMMVDLPLYLDPGVYEMRATVSSAGRSTGLCQPTESGGCQLMLGTHHVRR